jgi:hypothetical protein
MTRVPGELNGDWPLVSDKYYSEPTDQGPSARPAYITEGLGNQSR